MNVLIQYYSLYCIHASTDGQPNAVTAADHRFDSFTATNFPRWLEDDGWNDNNRPPCGNLQEEPWHGITCTSNQVTEINLHENVLTGIFPPEVQLLASDHPSQAGWLQVIDLYDNPFLFNDFDLSWVTNLGPAFGT